MDLSAIEGLPRELFRELIDYAPDAVFKLRLASRVLLTRVNNYTVEKWEDAERQNDEPFVQELTVAAKPLKSGAHMLYLSMEIAKCHARLFNLRIIGESMFNFTQYMSRAGDSGDVSSYNLEVDVSSADKRMFARLGEYMGDRIGKVAASIHEFHVPSLTLVSSMLEGIDFEELQFKTEFMSKGTSDYLVHLVSRHNVNNLSLDVERSGIGFENAAELLRSLSFLVSKMYIFQQAALGISEQSPFFFGILGADWVPVIHDMLMSKLDKLKIVNVHHKGYISTSDAIELKQKLASIEKKLWFETSSFGYTRWGTQRSHENDCVIEENCNELSIKHYSRTNEPF